MIKIFFTNSLSLFFLHSGYQLHYPTPERNIQARRKSKTNSSISSLIAFLFDCLQHLPVELLTNSKLVEIQSEKISISSPKVSMSNKSQTKSRVLLCKIRILRQTQFFKGGQWYIGKRIKVTYGLFPVRVYISIGNLWLKQKRINRRSNHLCLWCQ